MSTIIRLALTIYILIKVYSETGVFTTLALSLISLSFELVAFLISKKNKHGA